MATLAQLIQDARGEDSYEAVAKRGGMTQSALHRFASGKNANFPEPETIGQLARALRVTPQAVIVAAAEGLGYPLNQDAGSMFARLLPPEVDGLPDWAQQLILDQVRAMVEHLAPAHGERAVRDLADATLKEMGAASTGSSEID